jgi:AN1-type zinc finger and ubiquitin domain-containing protein 1
MLFLKLFFCGMLDFILHAVSGIPVSHQHLLYNLQELDDSACLIDYAIQDGATLKLVLSMRGGPISTRRLPPGEELAWKELRDFVESNR